MKEEEQSKIAEVVISLQHLIHFYQDKMEQFVEGSLAYETYKNEYDFYQELLNLVVNERKS